MKEHLVVDGYLENRLEERTRAALEAWRRKKPRG